MQSPSLDIHKNHMETVLGPWLWVTLPEQVMGPERPQIHLHRQSIQDPMTCVWDVPVHGCLCAAAVGGRGLRCVCAGVHDGLHMDVPPMSVCSVCIQLGVHVDQHVCAHTTAHVTEVLVCPCALLCRLICVAVGMAGSDWKGGSSVCVPMCYCENCI